MLLNNLFFNLKCYYNYDIVLVDKNDKIDG